MKHIKAYAYEYGFTESVIVATHRNPDCASAATGTCIPLYGTGSLFYSVSRATLLIQSPASTVVAFKRFCSPLPAWNWHSEISSEIFAALRC
eukprot:scaffold24412_cov31-Prasinocladus_malaysianus.AAC.1